MELPGLSAQLEVLIREHKIRETVFLLLAERYEQRKVDEARNLPTFVIADDAALPTWRVRPTLRAVPVGMLAGILLALAVVLVPPWWNDLRRRAALEAQSGAAGAA
jgi:uncharacterized protein involved in exopolysaccharide biosynthesis